MAVRCRACLRCPVAARARSRRESRSPGSGRPQPRFSARIRISRISRLLAPSLGSRPRGSALGALVDQLAGPRERPAWFGPSVGRVLREQDTIIAAAGPRELEQVVAELTGAEVYWALNEAARPPPRPGHSGHPRDLRCPHHAAGRAPPHRKGRPGNRRGRRPRTGRSTRDDDYQRQHREDAPWPHHAVTGGLERGLVGPSSSASACLNAAGPTGRRPRPLGH